MGVQVPVLQWPLAGRDSELKAFAAAWANRRCQAVVISGPAGVGKTRLAEECLAQAVRGDFVGARATASAAAAQVPLGAIAHLIPAGVDLADPVTGFAMVATALARRKQRRALWLDDLHLLDTASAVLLRQLLDAGVMRLIATVRTDEPMGDAVEALCHGDAVYRVDLAELDREQVEKVLQKVLGGPVGRRTLQALHEASSGNVLYLHELVTGALAAGTLASDGAVWEMAEGALQGTARLSELVQSRVAAAGPAGQPVLRLLALCEPIGLADAEAAAPLSVLADLEQMGLIRIGQDRRRSTVALAHPLYGEVLRADLPVLHGRALLLAQAERTEAHGARRREDALHLAAWRLAATGTADPRLLVRAAICARHVHHYKQVVTLLQALPDRQHTTATELMLGEAFFRMGRWDQAEKVLAQADTLAADEQEKLAVIIPRTTNLLFSNSPLAEALAVNDAALDRITSPAGRRMLKLNEGYMRIAAGRPKEGVALLGDLESDASQAQDVSSWLRSALMYAMGLALVGRTREAVAWAERAYAAHQKLDEHALAAHPVVQRVSLILALTEDGRLDDANAVGERAYAQLTTPDTFVRAWMAVTLGRAQWQAGHPASARRWWSEAAAVARTIDFAMALRLALGGIAGCAAVLGDLEAADTALAECHALPPLPPGIVSAGEQRLSEAWLLTARGRLTMARTALADGAASARNSGHVTSEAFLLTDIARLGGAKEVADRLAELAHQCDGAFAPARAHLAAALAADDPERLLTAAGELQAIGADLMSAEAAAAAAAAWRRAGQARLATAATQQAQACAARCEGAHTPLLSTAESAASLTAREREIALLAAANTSSKTIAATLHLSVRTIDNHLQHAYAKLGVTTRHELSAALGVKTTTPSGPAGGQAR
ncbi:AAA family ATPase [Streptomyces sp. NBC_00233]|uniref:LuxR C-terminal-related transcriptional regulator n=1 Tax=Streptomyces sp. NBC_00233 TaxID=2975686 RepID=UPI00224CF2A0|nr:LuxR family transcriptional regulator [Streptomyces sp. NBC_00233]MCX5233112.1 LuxR C-terminal-related transcriptional regulator [Streptomyces sp. NBC_00233]